MTVTIVNSKQSLQRTLADLPQLFEQYKYLEIKIRKGTDRSLSANAISHVWYHDVARRLGDSTPTDVRCFCKLHFGVPILLEDDDEFREEWQTINSRYTYEEKLKVMRILPVTSRMTTAQMNRYRDDVQDYWNGQGIALEYLERTKNQTK